MSKDDADDTESMLIVRELVLALMSMPSDAPVVIIDSVREVPIPYRVGVGWAESVDGMSMPIFAIVVGDNVASVSESGTILFGADGPFKPDARSS